MAQGDCEVTHVWTYLKFLQVPHGDGPNEWWQRAGGRDRSERGSWGWKRNAAAVQRFKLTLKIPCNKSNPSQRYASFNVLSKWVCYLSISRHIKVISIRFWFLNLYRFMKVSTSIPNKVGVIFIPTTHWLEWYFCCCLRDYQILYVCLIAFYLSFFFFCNWAYASVIL